MVLKCEQCLLEPGSQLPAEDLAGQLQEAAAAADEAVTIRGGNALCARHAINRLRLPTQTR